MNIKRKVLYSLWIRTRVKYGRQILVDALLLEIVVHLKLDVKSDISMEECLLGPVNLKIIQNS